MLDWDFYLSENPVIDHERDVPLEYMKTSMQMSVIREELMPDTTADISDLGKGFILPSIRCGRWYVGVIAGDTKPEEEKLWSNNIRVQPIDVICPNDVYSIDAGNFQQSTFYIWKEAPAKVTFDLTVTNVGLNDIPASAEQTNFDIGLALSSDGMLDSHDYILDTSIQYSGAERLLQYASHQQGESFAFHGLSAEITIPDATCDAARFLIVFVVSESDSILVNNDAALQFRPSCSVASADVQADEISVTGPLTPNVAVDFTLTGKVLVNLGAAVSSVLNSTCDITDEVHRCIGLASTSFGRLANRVFLNKDLTTKTKVAVYSAICLSILLYASETWTLYRRHIRMLEQFHMRCLQRILGLKWWHKVPHTEVRRRANIEPIESLLLQRQLRWAGHVICMPSNRLPRHILYGELSAGNRNAGGQQKRYKDNLKANLKKCNIKPQSLEKLAEQRSRWREACTAGITSFTTNFNRQCKERRAKRHQPSSHTGEPFNYKLWLSLDDELDPLEDFDLKYPLPQGRPFPSALTETENRLDLSGTTRTGSGLHIPADVDRRYCGWIYIIAQLDSNNTAHELDENNNIAVTNEPVELTCEEDVFSVSLLKFYPSQRYLWNGVFTPVKVQVTVTCHIDSCPTASESSDHFQLDVLAASDEMETYSVALSWDGSMTSNPEDAQMADFSELRSVAITLEGGLKLDTDDDTCKQLKHLGVRLSNGSSEEVTDLDFAAVPENDVQWAAAEFVCASDKTIDLSITRFGLTSPEYSFQSPSGFAMILQVLITEQDRGVSSVFGDQLNFDFDLFLSDDETLDMDDIMVHHDKSSVRPYLQGALSNGLTLDLGGAMQFSQEDYATFCGRDMHLIVKVDSRDIDPTGRQKGQLDENLEGNNIASTPITLVNCTTQLDLSVEAFSVSDSDVVQAGSPLTLSLSVDIVSVDIDSVFSKKSAQEQNYNFRLILSQDETLDPTGDEPSSCLLYRESELRMRMETCEAECAMSGDYTQCVQQCVGQMWAMSHDCLTDLADDADIPDLVLPFSTTQIPQLQEEVMHPYVTDNFAMNKTGNSTTVSHTITSGDTAPFLQLPHRGYVCNRYWHIGVDVFVTEEAERTETSTQNNRALQRIYVFCPADSLSLLLVHFMGEFQYKRKVWADVSYPISYSILLGNLGKDNIPPAAAHRSNFYIDLYFSEDEFFDAEEDKWLGTSESPEGISAGLVKQIGPMPGTLRLTMDECEASKRTANMFVVVRPSMDLQLDSVPVNNYIGTPISPYTVYGLCTIPGRLDLGITRFELIDDHVIHTNQPKPFLLEVDLQVDGLARLFGANQDDPSGLSWGFRFVLLSSKDQDPFTDGIRLHHNYSTENRDILRQGVSSNVIHQFNSHGLTLHHEDFGMEPLCGVAYLAAIVWPQRPNMARIDPVRSNDVMTIEVLLKCDGDVMGMENFQVRTVLPQMFIAPDAPTLLSFDADLINLSPHPIMANLKEDNFIFKAYLSVTPTLDLHSFEYWDLQLELLPSPQAYGHPMHPKAPMVDIQGQLNGAMGMHGHIRLKDVVGYVTMPAEACDEAEYLMVAVHTQPSLPYTETIFHNNYMAYPINQFTNLKCSGTSDLIITDFSLLSDLRRRRSLSDEDNVVEQGQPKRISIDVSSGSFSDDDYSLKFYISKDSDWDPIDQEIVYNEGSQTLTIPSYTDQQYCGMAYLVAVVDGDNSVEESSEHNNQASLEILYQCAEDLFVLSDVSMNPTEKKVYFLDVTNTLSLEYTVHHLGSQAITGITTPAPLLATTTAQPNTTTTPMPLPKTFDIKVYLHDSDDLDQGMPVEIPTWAAVYQAGSAYDMSRTLDTGETIQHSLEMPVTLNEDICEGNPTKIFFYKLKTF
ncbi:uncharacterized protein [Branchiostoma lanceolatum]|uniref:uncharacterized protein n=1 Tax=Branchiostoma lanceolatum TaxID=7740 RepID=UPI003453148D